MGSGPCVGNRYGVGDAPAAGDTPGAGVGLAMGAVPDSAEGPGACDGFDVDQAGGPVADIVGSLVAEACMTTRSFPGHSHRSTKSAAIAAITMKANHTRIVVNGSGLGMSAALGPTCTLALIDESDRSWATESFRKLQVS